MSMQFSIFSKTIAFVVVVAMCTTLVQEAQAYHCQAEEDKYWDEFWDLVEKGAYMALACSPPSLKTGVGVALCAVASAAFFRQNAKTRDANRAWEACKREHEPN